MFSGTYCFPKKPVYVYENGELEARFNTRELLAVVLPVVPATIAPIRGHGVAMIVVPAALHLYSAK